jgi:hypothetical protein
MRKEAEQAVFRSEGKVNCQDGGAVRRGRWNCTRRLDSEGSPLLPTTDDNLGAWLGMPIFLCGQSKDDDSANEAPCAIVHIVHCF